MTLVLFENKTNLTFQSYISFHSTLCLDSSSPHSRHSLSKHEVHSGMLLKHIKDVPMYIGLSSLHTQLPQPHTAKPDRI